jgi:DNA polymerase III subunit gamma/tau
VVARALRDAVADGLLRVADWATRTACRLRPPTGRSTPDASIVDASAVDASTVEVAEPGGPPAHWAALVAAAQPAGLRPRPAAGARLANADRTPGADPAPVGRGPGAGGPGAGGPGAGNPAAVVAAAAVVAPRQPAMAPQPTAIAARPVVDAPRPAVARPVVAEPDVARSAVTAGAQAAPRIAVAVPAGAAVRPPIRLTTPAVGLRPRVQVAPSRSWKFGGPIAPPVRQDSPAPPTARPMAMPPMAPPPPPMPPPPLPALPAPAARPAEAGTSLPTTHWPELLAETEPPDIPAIDGHGWDLAHLVAEQEGRSWNA